jgi:hypothetical protein
MDGRAFLAVAHRLVAGPAEADWRAAAGRAYYALLLEGRDALRRWGFPPPRRDQLHAFVRLRFVYARDPDPKRIGLVLEQLVTLRNEADYQTDTPGKFGTAQVAHQTVLRAEGAVALLDQIEADPARRQGAIAAIRAAFP